ncbi:MAG TPA: DUF2203 domain-containing protein, partial [Planctomycetota bacterium]|nr:DUF2203 domain-containing protein [Planctomycetota bacterium]
IYTAREASALIPKLARAFDDVDEIRQRLKTLKGKMDVLEMIWGEEVQAETNPDHKEHKHYLEEIEQAKKDYDSAGRRIADFEAVVKSIEQGLVDFYGVIDGRLVFLCWKRGEKSIEYYHHLEDGFQGRQPIPAEELAR